MPRRRSGRPPPARGDPPAGPCARAAPAARRAAGSRARRATRIGHERQSRRPRSSSVSPVPSSLWILVRERGRDGDDDSEVEQRPELDDVGQPAGHRDRQQRHPVLGDDQPEQLEQDGTARDDDRDPDEDERDRGVLGVHVAEPRAAASASPRTARPRRRRRAAPAARSRRRRAASRGCGASARRAAPGARPPCSAARRGDEVAARASAGERQRADAERERLAASSAIATDRRRTTITAEPERERSRRRARCSRPDPSDPQAGARERDRAADPEQRRHAQDPHLRLGVSTTRQRGAERDHLARPARPRLAANPRGCGRNSSAPRTSTTQWRAAARPLQEREVATGVLEQRRPRGSSSARDGCRGCRSAGARSQQDHERERDRAAPVRRLAPDLPARCGGAHRAQVGAVRRQRGDEQREHAAAPRRIPRSSDRARRPSARSRCRCPTPRWLAAKRASASRPTSTSASLPSPKFPDRPASGTSATRGEQAGGDQRRREPVDDARPLRVDGALCTTADAASGRAAAATGRGGPAGAPSASGSDPGAAAPGRSRGAARRRDQIHLRALRSAPAAAARSRARADTRRRCGCCPSAAAARPPPPAAPPGSSARTAPCRRARARGRSRRSPGPSRRAAHDVDRRAADAARSRARAQWLREPGRGPAELWHDRLPARPRSAPGRARRDPRSRVSPAVSSASARAITSRWVCASARERDVQVTRELPVRSSARSETGERRQHEPGDQTEHDARRRASNAIPARIPTAGSTAAAHSGRRGEPSSANPTTFTKHSSASAAVAASAASAAPATRATPTGRYNARAAATAASAIPTRTRSAAADRRSPSSRSGTRPRSTASGAAARRGDRGQGSRLLAQTRRRRGTATT